MAVIKSQIESSENNGRYSLTEQIGQGGEADIYRAHDTQLNRWVAIKRLRYSEQHSQICVDTALTEAKHLASLQHPNIVTIHDFIHKEDGVLVVMEYIHGGTLQDIVEEKALGLDDFIEFSKQTLEGLISAHSIDMYHRDIKASNIMMSKLPSGAYQVKILDFGLARMKGETRMHALDPDDSVFGSIFTMPPEQIEREEMDARSDLYSFGCTCYFALTKKNPFDAPTIPEIISAHLHHRVKHISQVRPDLPPVLCEWVMKLIEKKPENRYQSAAEAEHDLKAAFFPSVATTSHLLAAASAREQEESLRRRRTTFIILILTIVSLVGGGTGAYFLWKDKFSNEPEIAKIAEPPVVAPVAVATVVAEPAPTPKAGPTPLPPVNGDELLKSVGEETSVEGKIFSTGENKSGSVKFLLFESSGPGFKLVFIVRDGLGEFTKANIERYVGRNVKVTGRVTEFEGAPQIVIRDFAQIKTL